ncbi:hypothetical protein TrVE_jg9012 [Triparma verrucosa]|uniref:Uncharacterized protein n=1 Tax=Triparma verrucosa TaxID=1606542 RepID=A0A9W7FME5_9STRA|nr:hypothetical protein TrVE_jg9012 [Triparma verrucosa]
MSSDRDHESLVPRNTRCTGQVNYPPPPASDEEACKRDIKNAVTVYSESAIYPQNPSLSNLLIETLPATGPWGPFKRLPGATFGGIMCIQNCSEYGLMALPPCVDSRFFVVHCMHAKGGGQVLTEAGNPIMSMLALEPGACAMFLVIVKPDVDPSDVIGSTITVDLIPREIDPQLDDASAQAYLAGCKLPPGETALYWNMSAKVLRN